jgi:hypothetical protein
MHGDAEERKRQLRQIAELNAQLDESNAAVAEA